MKPLGPILAGVAVGMAVVLPLARAQLDTAGPSAAVVVTAPAVPGPPSTSSISPAPTGAPAPGPADLAHVTVTGPVVATRYGPVQVQVTLVGTELTAAPAIQLPSGDGESRQINASAGPRLEAAALAAQSAQIDGVSGASWTSDGYRRSLQAALDTARASVAAASAGQATS